VASADDIGRAILAPPNVPAERVAALRKAFQELARDPDFIRESDRRNVALGSLAGDALQALVNQSMTLTPELTERIRQTIRQ
jgi:tripartite-type tricarboxylate transporter receptor subunit TctC